MARQGGSSAGWRKLREEAFRMYGRQCVICGDPAKEIDHIIELADGGEDTLSNLQPLCKPCHLKKTNHSKSLRMHEAKKMKKAQTNNRFFHQGHPSRRPTWESLSPMVKTNPPMSKKFNGVES